MRWARGWSEQWVRRLSLPGLTIALFSIWMALSPSLIPRLWWVNALVIGLSMTVGYLVGRLLGALGSAIVRWTSLEISMSAAAARNLRIAWYTGLSVIMLTTLVTSYDQQQEIAALVRMPGTTRISHLSGTLAGIGLFLVLLFIGRLIRSLWLTLAAVFRRFLPRYVWPVATTVLIVGAGAFVWTQLIVGPTFWWLGQQAERLNSQTYGVSAPTSPLRSGGPGSSEAFADLGMQGRAFVAQGPDADRIAEVTGEPAVDPIRIYAAYDPDLSVQQIADRAGGEIDRTGAMDRGYVVVVTSTGTGWLEHWAVQALEYLTAGDVATVTMQYSYLPSALSFLTERDLTEDAGAALFGEVEQRWAALPEDQRPRLLVSGNSLGAFGGHGAFEDSADMLDRVDGALWMGTPRFTPIWETLTASRREGTPEVAPVVDNGRNIRFVTRPIELTQDYFGGPYADWGFPRVVYLQHPSDPVVWWSTDLLWTEPEWMNENVGRDVSDQLAWFPWVTFWQIATDMPRAGAPPGGHAHQYHAEVVPAWASVLGMDPDGDYSAIIAAIRAGDVDTG